MLLAATTGGLVALYRLPVVLAVVGAVALLAVAAYQRVAAVAMLAAITLPLFLSASTGLTLLQPGGGRFSEEEGGLSVQISLVLIGVLAGLAWVCRTATKRPPVPLFGRGLVAGLLLLYTLSIWVGFTKGAGLLGFAFYAQTIIPLLAWYAAAANRITPRAASLTVVGCTLAALLYVIAVGVGSGGLTGSYAVVETLVRTIPQYRNLFPFIVVCGLALAITGWNQHRKTSIGLFAAAVLTLPMTWSRTGVAMMAIAVSVAFFARPGRASTTTRMLLGILGGILLGTYALRTVLSGVLGERQSVGTTLEASGETRAGLATEALDRIAGNPLLGDTFVPETSVLVSARDSAHLFPAHNQYLDIALRGGVLALVLTVVLLFVFARRAWRLRRSPDPQVAAFHAALLAIIAAVASGSFAQLYLIQPWTGGLFFALLGVSSACMSGDEPEVSQRGDERVDDRRVRARGDARVGGLGDRGRAVEPHR